MKRLVGALALTAAAALAQAQPCGGGALQLQVLGSGHAELDSSHAGAATLIWSEGKARLLIDVGPDTALRLAQTEAGFDDLDAILLSHLRTERTAGLPAVIGSANAEKRRRPLLLYGPAGNRWMPSAVAFTRSLFDPTRGAWRHLGQVLSPLARESYKLEPHDLRPHPAKLGVRRDERDQSLPVPVGKRMRVTAFPVTVGPTPTLSWRIEKANKSIVVLGDSRVADEGAQSFAHGADVLVSGVARREDAKTALVSVAKLAQAAKVKQLVLGAGVAPTFAEEEELNASIREHYDGAIEYVNDLDCLTL